HAMVYARLSWRCRESTRGRGVCCAMVGNPEHRRSPNKMLRLQTKRRVYEVADSGAVDVRDGLARKIAERANAAMGFDIIVDIPAPPRQVPPSEKEVVRGDELVKVGDIYLIRRAPHGFVAGFHVSELETMEEV